MTFEELYATRRCHYLKAALSVLRNRADAEECVQDAFLRMYLHWDACRSNRVSWGYATVHNRALELRRRRRPEIQMPAHLGADEPATRSHEDPVVARVAVKYALGKIRRSHREAVLMSLAGDVPTETSTVKVKACRGRIEMRAFLAR